MTRPIPSSHAPSGPCETAPTPRAIAALWSAAYASADIEALARLYAADAAYHDETVWDRTRGIAAICEGMRKRLKAYQAAGVEAACQERHLISDGAHAVLEWTDPLGLHYCTVIECRDGLIVSQRDYVDPRAYASLYD